MQHVDESAAGEMVRLENELRKALLSPPERIIVLYVGKEA
jgi:hypothetical protein